MNYESSPFRDYASISVDDLKDQANSLLNLVAEEQQPLRVLMNSGKEFLLFPQDMLAPISDPNFRLILLSATFLEKELESFLISGTSKRTIHFQKNRFYKSNNAPSVVDYTLSSTNQSIAISTHIETLKVHLLSMLGVDFIRKELRKEKEIKIHVNYIYNVYRDILRNTVESLTGIDAENFKVSVSLKGTNCTSKQAVGYFLYMLQAANLISLVQISAVSPTIRKIQLSTHLDKYIRHINDALLDIGTTEFGRLVT